MGGGGRAIQHFCFITRYAHIKFSGCVSPRQAFPSRSSRYPGSHSQRNESKVSTQVWLHPPLLDLHSSEGREGMRGEGRRLEERRGKEREGERRGGEERGEEGRERIGRVRMMKNVRERKK